MVPECGERVSEYGECDPEYGERSARVAKAYYLAPRRLRSPGTISPALGESDASVSDADQLHGRPPTEIRARRNLWTDCYT